MMKLSFSQLDLAFLSSGAGSEGKKGRDFSFLIAWRLKLFFVRLDLARTLCILLPEGNTLKKLGWCVGSAVILKALRVRRLA